MNLKFRGMKTLLIFAQILMLSGIFSVLEADPVELGGLSAFIENAKFDENTSTITLDFVLKNSSNEEIRIAERWNSWGAFQWTVLVTLEDDTIIRYKNPQGAWKRNFLTTKAIEPGGEFRMACGLFLEKSSVYDLEHFVPEKKAKRFSLPVKLVGKFSATHPGSAFKDETNWVGAIETPEVALGDFSRKARWQRKISKYLPGVIAVIGWLCCGIWIGLRFRKSKLRDNAEAEFAGDHPDDRS